MYRSRSPSGKPAPRVRPLNFSRPSSSIETSNSGAAMAASSAADSGMPPEAPPPSAGGNSGEGSTSSGGGGGASGGGTQPPRRAVLPTLTHQRTEFARRHDTAAIRVEVAVDSAVESEQAVHVPVTSSHFETAFATMKSLVAGGLAGMVAKSVVAPVDRIKILFQVSSEPFSLPKVFNLMRRIHREEGLGGLWKGNSATMLRVFPYAGIQFMTFDAIKAHILRLEGQPEGGQLSNVESLFAGSFAGFVSCTCTYPLDLARARLAVERTPAEVAAASGAGAAGPPMGARAAHNVLYIFRAAYQEGGILYLYRGITPTLLGILPYAGIAFTINDKANHQIAKLTGEDPNTLQKLACGAFAGLAAQSATYPLDVVRRRMQTTGMVTTGASVEGALYGAGAAGAGATGGAPARAAAAAGGGGGAGAPPGMMAILRDVHAREGWRGLFKGLSMNWIKGPVALGISFTTFDFLKRTLNVQPPHKKAPL